MNKSLRCGNPERIASAIIGAKMAKEAYESVGFYISNLQEDPQEEAFRIVGNMADNKPVYSTGVSGSTLLGIAFVVLKLCHVISWSWWWITLPFWAIPVVVCSVVGISFLVIGTMALCTEGYRMHKARKDRMKTYDRIMRG